jgi:isopropylmalate/homocitrate/citramalate synthase
MQLLECTTARRSEFVGTGLSGELTTMIIEGLIDSNIKIIEYGNAYASLQKRTAPLTDMEYLKAAAPYMDKAEIGMFLSAGNGDLEIFRAMAAGGLKFVRVGINAGDGEKALQSVEWVKKSGMKVRFAMMKGYVLTPQQAAQEAKMLAQHGVDEVTLMDSAGTCWQIGYRIHIGNG